MPRQFAHPLVPVDQLGHFNPASFHAAAPEDHHNNVFILFDTLKLAGAAFVRTLNREVASKAGTRRGSDACFAAECSFEIGYELVSRSATSISWVVFFFAEVTAPKQFVGLVPLVSGQGRLNYVVARGHDLAEEVDLHAAGGQLPHVKSTR